MGLTLEATAIAGAFVARADVHEDDRGSFWRTFDRAEFSRVGLDPHVEQASISRNRDAGTLRGMHYQCTPYEETKLVRCIRGRIFDVIIDLRPESASAGRWLGFELDESRSTAVVVPPGCAHGFLTMTANSDVYYQISAEYSPEHARGVRWDDESFGVEWPCPPSRLSDRDANYPDFTW